MALPLLTPEQTPWQAIASSSVANYFAALEAVFAAAAEWELSHSGTYTREFKPVAGSNIADCRILFFYSAGAATPHADALAAPNGLTITSPNAGYAYVGIAPDAGTTGPDNDPTAAIPYNTRWMGFTAFDQPNAASPMDRMYGVLSEEIVAIFSNETADHDDWRACILGAMGVAHPDDSEADERIWCQYTTNPTSTIPSTWATVLPTSTTTPLLSHYAASTGVAGVKMLAFDPTSPNTVRYLERHEEYVEAGSDEFTSLSGRLIVKPFSYVISTTPARNCCYLRQLGVGPNRVARTILQDGGGTDQGISWGPSETNPYNTLVFTTGIF